jgi:dCTP deaminase
MAYLGTSELKELLPTCIDQFQADRIDNVAYELCLGDEVYLTDSANGKKEKLDDKNSQVVIKPGQFALLLTKEKVAIPNNILAFISIKFSQKIKGLLNVSGFHVDPGFSGKIIFSVYNAGPATIVLDRGKPYFMIWFSKLSSSSIPYNGKHKNQNEISADNISALKGELASPNVLLDKIKANESLLKNIVWAVGILITLTIGLGIKAFWDASKFNEGYIVGVKERQAKAYVDSTIGNYNLDSVITHRVDSILLKNNIINDTTKKHS